MARIVGEGSILIIRGRGKETISGVRKTAGPLFLFYFVILTQTVLILIRLSTSELGTFVRNYFERTAEA